jgi:hypothetical protein
LQRLLSIRKEIISHDGTAHKYRIVVLSETEMASDAIPGTAL